MKSYIVSYDLNNRKDYSKLIDRLEQYSRAARINKSVWFLKSDYSHTEIRDDLKKYIDSDDSLFVGKLTGAAAWSNLDCSKHLKEYL